jgi:hypothetical protein
LQLWHRYRRNLAIFIDANNAFSGRELNRWAKRAEAAAI